MIHCISIWKAAVIYVLSIFMSGYLAVPKFHSCVAKPIFTHAVLKAQPTTLAGSPAPGTPQKQDEKVFLLIVGLIAVVVIGIIIYGIIKMASRIPAPDANPPPPPETNQPPVAYVPGPYITAKDLHDGFVKLADRHPAIESPEQPIYCCNVSTNGWLDRFQYHFNTNATIAIFTNAFCITLQGSENLKDWNNRINYVFYESTSGGVLQAGFSNNVPVSSVYYRNSSYMDGQHYGRALALDAKPQEYFRLVSMTNYPSK